jgi:arylsulfatase A-like enzyme
MKRLFRIALLAALALAGVVGTRHWWSADPRRPPNIVLITVESLRPDRMSLHGAPLDTTPQLEMLADEAMVYDNAHSVTSWTLAAHASLFTGLYPAAHQAVGPLDTLGASYQTVAEVLGAHGYQTAGVASGPYLRHEFNLTQGFEYYDESPASLDDQAAHGDVTNPRMLAAIETFLREHRDPTRPLLLFAYFWDPHYDYIPPPPYDSEFVGPEATRRDVTGYMMNQTINAATPADELAYVRAQYDGEIRWTDEHLGRLFALLREAGLWDDTVVIVTSDHGEEFFDHGTKGHKNNLFVESVHVPLIVKYEAHRDLRGRDGRLCSLVDLLPTILELTAIPVPGPLHGVSLLGPASPDRAIYLELVSMWFDLPNQRMTREEHVGIQRGAYKLVEIRAGEAAPDVERLLFDRATDARERTNLLDAGTPAAFEPLAAALDRWTLEMAETRARFEAGGPIPLTDEQRGRLRALGYLH